MRTICIQRWHCETCGIKHSTEYEPQEDSGMVMARVKNEHQRLSGGCRGRVWVIDREGDDKERKGRRRSARDS